MMSRPGPIALVGSGEFLPAMAGVDAHLMAGRAPRAAYLPTASALEGDERFDYWVELGRAHFEGLGVEPVSVPVRTRADAQDPVLAGLVEGAGLVYLSGGDPHHLAATLRASVVWAAIVAAWSAGSALAGCSAGAMALCAGAPPDLGPGGARRAASMSTVEGAAAPTPSGTGGAGLEMVPNLAVIPHFDRMEHWRPDAVAWFGAWCPPEAQLVGIDEDTALIHDGRRWSVQGRRSVWIIGDDGRTRHDDGTHPELPAPSPG
jgi:cyanophycinase